AALDHLESLFLEAKKERVRAFVITDLTRMRELASAKQRRLTGEWSKRTADLTRATSAGSAAVTPSAILRGLITAVFWFQPPTAPYFAMGTRHEAMLKAIEMLRAANAALPPRLVDFREHHASRSGTSGSR